MAHRITSLRSDERGTSVIELALAAPILAVLTIGIIDLSNGFSEKLRLEQAAQRAVEKVMNGRAILSMNTTGNTTTMGALKTEAASAAGVPDTNVTTDFWLECNGTRNSTYYTTCTNYARYMSVSITKTYTPFFNYKFHNRTANTYTLTGAATVRIQ
ncbi:TadE/TadG family type IV pilus assembly protein [Sphingomonas arenae]|uniref:TadE/TadG family type IV pilus assembly protein n=1 Tax=Sphingomonas arenae TaxID=2812555 RepID=UPI001968850D|nr:TadE family protein [Sphingomonas arenae]